MMTAAIARQSDRRPSHPLSETHSAADSADVQSTSGQRKGQHLPVAAQPVPASPDPQHKQDISGSVSPRPRQEGPDEHSRCNTPQQPVAEFPPGLESLMQAAWQVPFPDSSIIGRSPRGGGACTADSSHSDGSNANLRDFGLNGADSPPWSPRRVPPAHVWGEGPPRAPGYRSGGACYPITSPGVSAANLVEAACELHALLQRRSAAGLGPLVGADGSLGTPDDPAVHPCPGKGVGTTAEKADTAAAEQLPPSPTPSPGPDRCCAAAFPPVSNGAAAHLPAAAAQLGKTQGLKRPAAWQCANDSQLSFGDRIDAEVADEVLSSMRPHQRWASAPPVQERHSCAELADDSCSAGQHAASAPPEDRPPRAAAAGASFGSNAYFGVGANSGGGARLGAGLSMPELMGVSPLFPDRILSRGQAGCAVLRPEQASFGRVAAARLQDGNVVADRGGPRRRTKRRLF